MFVSLVVSDLLMNEAVKDKKEKCLTKCKDSGHDSGQSSLNTGDPFALHYRYSSSIFSGCESFSESSG